jgi:hypothetical protein
MKIQSFKAELNCLKDIKDKQATLVLEEADLRIEYMFPLKEAMCIESVNYPSLYDRLMDYGCIDRNAIISELESDTMNEYAYQSKVWECEYDFEDEDEDDQKPFFNGIGGGWFEFPDDVFKKDNFVFSVKRNLYFKDGEEVDFEAIKEIVNDSNKCKFYWVNHPKAYNIEKKDDLVDFFENMTKKHKPTQNNEK